MTYHRLPRVTHKDPFAKGSVTIEAQTKNNTKTDQSGFKIIFVRFTSATRVHVNKYYCVYLTMILSERVNSLQLNLFPTPMHV